MDVIGSRPCPAPPRLRPRPAPRPGSVRCSPGRPPRRHLRRAARNGKPPRSRRGGFAIRSSTGDDFVPVDGSGLSDAIHGRTGGEATGVKARRSARVASGSGGNGLPRLYLDPVEGSGDRLLPEAILLFAFGGIHLWLPFLVLRPVRPQI